MRIARPLLLALVVAAFVMGAPGAPAAAQQQQICFPGTPGISDCIDPALAPFWRTNGGLPVFGYPIGPVEAFAPAGAPAPLQAQWLERNRLELHPENRAPYNVLLGRIGAERLAQLGRDSSDREAGALPGCLWFAETGHNVCDQAAGAGFKSYWESNGLRVAGLNRYQQSLALFGLPLTTANPEPGPDGELIVTQWFERARFEWHPANPARSRVLLGLLGREARVAAPTPQASPAATGPTIFGVEVNRGNVGLVAGRIGEAKASWVRYNGVNWAEIEPQRGQRNWAALAGIEAELAAISAAGGTPMLVVRGAPSWAQADRGNVCGPIREQALPDFATFVGELTARLSKAPYNVKHWELGNEPDADRKLVGGDSVFGCWGDSGQPDYGAGQYVAMLKTAYPAIKAADPAATVVHGGLLLECDPTIAGLSRPCRSGTFFEEVLAAGGGPYFDVVAYHSYTYWGPERTDWDRIFLNWRDRGGFLLGKLDFLKAVMASHNVQKPVIMNEGGLICNRGDGLCGSQAFYADQANHAVRMYVRSQAAGLLGAIWYTLDGPGWRDGGMLDASQQPRPAFTTLSFLSPLLGGAQVTGSQVDGPFERYQLRKGNTLYEVYWMNDGSTREVAAPAGARTLYTHLGERRPLGARITVGFEPLIVEATP